MKVLSRKIIFKALFCTFTGAVLGLICASMASLALANWHEYWGSSIMWAILYNRILIGLVVFGVSLINPYTFIKVRIRPWQRGFVVGTFVSLDLSLWFLMIPYSEIYYLTISSILIGGVYGLIIDHYSAKFFGHRHTLEKAFVD